MTDLSFFIESAQRRVIKSREIADELRDDDRIHRLAMQTVFVLEDVLFALRQAAERNSDLPSFGPKL